MTEEREPCGKTCTCPKSEDTTLSQVVQRLLRQDRLHDALGAWYLAGPCTCGVHAAGMSGWAIVTVQPGLQLHFCGDCGRGAIPNREQLLGAEPWRAHDVALYDGRLVALVGAPGPTGMVHVETLDADDPPTAVHVAQLNLEV